ncbi:MAG: hypothetical protein WCX88_04025, partial [Patescibacteria group bacterium]
MEKTENCQPSHFKKVLVCALLISLHAIGIAGLLELTTNTSNAATLFTEDFSDTTYKDAVNTTANWDTTGGVVNLPFESSWVDESAHIPGMGSISAMDFDSHTNTLYVASGGVLYSYNGTSWTNESAHISGLTGVLAMSFDSNTHTLYVGGSGSKILYSYDGADWVDESANFGSMLQVSAIGFNSSTNVIYVGGRSPISGVNVFYSRTAGVWADESASLLMADVDKIGFNPYNDNLYVGRGGTLYSYDGVDWADESLNIASITAIRAFGFDSNTNTFYVGGNGDLGKTLYSYNGTSWADESANISSMARVFTIGFDSNANVLYVGGFNSRTLYSYDGSDWVNESANVTNSLAVMSFAFDSLNNLPYFGGLKGDGTGTLYTKT